MQAIILDHPTWASYFEADVFLLVICYLFVAIRFYGNDVRLLLRQSSTTDRQEQLVYEETSANQADGNDPNLYVRDNYPDDDIRDTHERIKGGKPIVTAASDKAYAPYPVIIVNSLFLATGHQCGCGIGKLLTLIFNQKISEDEKWIGRFKEKNPLERQCYHRTAIDDAG
jgi:hypothetical protein